MKKRFTLEDHKTIGRDLKEISTALMKIHIKVASAYGKSKTESRALSLSVKQIGKARCDLEEELFLENIGNTESGLTNIYYPSEVKK